MVYYDKCGRRIRQPLQRRSETPPVGAGKRPAAQVQCVLCEKTPCDCPEFGTPAYFELIDKRHGRR